MILVRSPLRISIGGGGTDLPSYYTKHNGLVISAAIDKYIYTSISRCFSDAIKLKYSSTEEIDSIHKIKHPIIREVLNLLTPTIKNLEITTIANIPSGTGLGSSSTFTCSLIKALCIYVRRAITQNELAEIACEIELGKLNEPIGKQDQYISAYGGLTKFTFNQDHSVGVSHLPINKERIRRLENNLLLFFTGFTRRAGDILADQDTKSKEGNSAMLDNLHKVKTQCEQIQKIICVGNLDDYGVLMRDHWENKMKRSPNISNAQINELINLGLTCGAIGGKLVGAGGGGFLLFYSNDPEKLRNQMSKKGIKELPFKFDLEGTKTLLP